MKCKKCGAEMVEKKVAGNGFGATSTIEKVCPQCGWMENNKGTGWSFNNPVAGGKNESQGNPFLKIPGWKYPWQD